MRKAYAKHIFKYLVFIGKLFDGKFINSKRELYNIAINHSADIDYKGFMKIYRKCTKEPYSSLTIDTTLPVNNPLRELAEISALSSGKLEKYEYMAEEDLKYKPEIIEKTKFEYSLLGKIFNKGLQENDKKEGILKKLKNIEGKDEEQLKAIKDQEEKQLQILTRKTGKDVDFRHVSFKGKLDSESKKPIIKLRNRVKKLIIQNLSALAQVSISIILPSFWI